MVLPKLESNLAPLDCWSSAQSTKQLCFAIIILMYFVFKECKSISNSSKSSNQNSFFGRIKKIFKKNSELFDNFQSCIKSVIIFKKIRKYPLIYIPQIRQERPNFFKVF